MQKFNCSQRRIPPKGNWKEITYTWLTALSAKCNVTDNLRGELGSSVLGGTARAWKGSSKGVRDALKIASHGNIRKHDINSRCHCTRRNRWRKSKSHDRTRNMYLWDDKDIPVIYTRICRGDSGNYKAPSFSRIFFWLMSTTRSG